jgi:SNF2 family DNA or RNA helicase
VRVPKAPRIKRVARSRHNSEYEYGKDDEEDKSNSASDDEGIMRSSRTSDDVGVEKILAHRSVDGKNEFLVKFHNLSYIHTEWISEEEMLQESSGSNRIKRFLSKPLSERHYLENHPFNPEYTQIERIVHGWDHPDENDPSIQSSSYLIKWTNLPYSEATWEKKVSVLELPEGEDRLKEFSNRPTLEQRRTKMVPAGWRPDRSEYQNMTESPIYKGENSLRPYQLEGVNWLVYCWTNRQSCIIADEMGLGKTVQSVAFVDLIYNRFSVRGPFLVIAPLSTIPHWQREFEAWTSTL